MVARKQGWFFSKANPADLERHARSHDYLTAWLQGDQLDRALDLLDDFSDPPTGLEVLTMMGLPDPEGPAPDGP